MMPDREKVIKGLECCHKFGFHEDCPYDKKDPHENQDTTCMMNLMTEALALLKEQQEQIDSLIEESASNAEMAEGLKELLKEQEAVKPKSKTRHGSTTMVQHWCGNCMVMLHGKPKYCPNCGRKVKWE